jgi:hypothetical protein
VHGAVEPVQNLLPGLQHTQYPRRPSSMPCPPTFLYASVRPEPTESERCKELPSPGHGYTATTRTSRPLMGAKSP